MHYESTVLFHSQPSVSFSLFHFQSDFFIPLFERWYEAWSRNSNHTVKAFPLNYLAVASFYRRELYLWTSLKARYLVAVLSAASLSFKLPALWTVRAQSRCLPSWKWRQHCLFVCRVPYTNKNTLKMKPRCNDDLKRNDTLSHNIVLSNSPELP